MLSNPNYIKKLDTETLNDFNKISDYDWICEAVVEKLDIKKGQKIEHTKNWIISKSITIKDIVKVFDMLENVCITFL